MPIDDADVFGFLAEAEDQKDQRQHGDLWNREQRGHDGLEKGARERRQTHDRADDQARHAAEQQADEHAHQRVADVGQQFAAAEQRAERADDRAGGRERSAGPAAARGPAPPRARSSRIGEPMVRTCSCSRRRRAMTTSRAVVAFVARRGGWPRWFGPRALSRRRAPTQKSSARSRASLTRRRLAFGAHDFLAAAAPTRGTRPGRIRARLSSDRPRADAEIRWPGPP